HIVNTASMAGLVAAPWTVSYSAAKYAIVGLSLSLRVEAATEGVRVSVLCPGVIRTPILDKLGKYGKAVQRISAGEQRALFDRLGRMAPTRFAEKALRAVARNRSIIIFPAWWRLIWWMNRLSPWLTEQYNTRSLVYARKNLLEKPAKSV